MRRVRLLLTAALVALPSLAIGTPAASATSRSVVSVGCRRLLGDIATGAVHLTMCSDWAVSGGSGTTDGRGQGPFTIHWHSGGTATYKNTSITSETDNDPSGTVCGSENEVTGVVTASTGPAKPIAVGGRVHFELCFSGGNSVTIEAGTVFRV
jgi:hypothetical protein